MTHTVPTPAAARGWRDDLPSLRELAQVSVRAALAGTGVYVVAVLVAVMVSIWY